MFQIVTVPDQAADSTEPVGTKPKFRFFSEEGSLCLFKEGRPNTGDDWSEKIACELAQLIDLPHADYELAMWRGKRGVISRIFIPQGGFPVLGNELLAEVIPGYQKTKFFRAKQYTLRDVLLILGTTNISDLNPQIRLPTGWTGFADVQTALDVFIGYLMFDAWIVNQDRHHENWSLVVTPEAKIHLAPSYDHASSLGSNETDENRQDRLAPRDIRRSMERYVERAASAFYASASSNRPLSTFEAFREAGKVQPKAAEAWLGRLQEVSSQTVVSIFDEVPRDRISSIAGEFAQRMLELNRRRLLALQGSLS